jgi:hypothetical protein
VSESDNDRLSSLLSSFALGPSWARATGGSTHERPTQSVEKPAKGGARRFERDAGPRDGGFAGRGQDRREPRDRDGGPRAFRGRDGARPERREGPPPRHEEVLPAAGVRVTLMPDAQAVHLIGKEVHQVARVYPLFDVAKILLAERGRCRAVFEVQDSHPPLLRGKLDDSLFLTRDEAMRHLWQSDLRQQLVEEETIETEPPTGNFQLVAKCGLSGEWLGPPNFHAYQSNLRRIHRERFPHLPFATYSSKVRTERGEEAVNAWLETMKRKTRWRLKGDGDEAWVDDLNEIRRLLAARCFDTAFEECRRVEVLASIPPANVSPSLMVSLKAAGNHARNHPAILIPAVCKALEAEHLPVFKRQGKLFTGPARPHPLPPGATLAERPGIMVEWIRANKPAKLEGLWKAVLPEGGTAPPAEFAADLFWLLHQGHILLFTDDTLAVQEVREPQAQEPAAEGAGGAAKKKKKKKKKKPATGTETTADVAESADAGAEDEEVAPEEAAVEPDGESEVAGADAEAVEDAPAADAADDSEVILARAEETAPAITDIPSSDESLAADEESSMNSPAKVDDPPGSVI